jgi:polysaccharide export outer membrane protein
MKAILIFACVYVLTATGAYAQPPTPTGDERYRIGYQDKLSIQVFRHPGLAQTVDVNSDGTINLFNVKERVVAVCKTERELANDVAEAYKKDYLRNPEVNVVAVEQRSRAFAVIGAVVKPGNFMINRRVRLLELLAAAGGPSDKAGSRLVVARTGSTSNCKLDEEPSTGAEEVAWVDYKIKDVLQAKQNPVMRAGDIVSLSEEDNVFVYGNVIKQGPVAFKEPITLMQAIASAEGVKPASKKDKVRVFRQRADSLERDEIIYDLDKISKKQAQDPYLEANDVVAVSEDAAKSIFRNLGKSLTGGLPSLFYRIP